MKRATTRLFRPPIYVPLLIALAATLVALVTHIDFAVSDLFYEETTGTWPYKHSVLQSVIYKFSPIPAIAVFAGGVIIALVSIWRKSWRRWTRGAIYWSLVMLLGPGLLVNALFKDLYGRPRPKQVIEYGGEMEFKPVWVVGTPGEAKSFPCGHASIGFYFMAGYFYWWRRDLQRARRWLLIGLIAGSVIGLSRIANGSHWFSDVVWAGAFMYFSSYLTAVACGLMKRRGDDRVCT